MDKLKEASDALKKLAGKFGPNIFQEAEVISVDAIEYQADLKTYEGLELFDCRLRALIGGSQSLDIMPKVGSKVLVAKLEDDDYFVLACDEIDSFKVTTDTTVLDIDAVGVGISKGQESLNGILNSLIDEILKIYAPMNKPGLTLIKQRINTLLK